MQVTLRSTTCFFSVFNRLKWWREIFRSITERKIKCPDCAHTVRELKGLLKESRHSQFWFWICIIIASGTFILLISMACFTYCLITILLIPLSAFQEEFEANQVENSCHHHHWSDWGHYSMVRLAWFKVYWKDNLSLAYNRNYSFV